MNKYLKGSLELIFNLLYLIVLSYAIIILVNYSKKINQLDVSQSECYTVKMGEKETEICEK